MNHSSARDGLTPPSYCKGKDLVWCQSSAHHEVSPPLIPLSTLSREETVPKMVPCVPCYAPAPCVTCSPCSAFHKAGEKVRRMKILGTALCPCHSTEPGHHTLAASAETRHESNHAFGYCRTGAPSHAGAKADSSSCLSPCATAVAPHLALSILPQLSTLGRSPGLTQGYQSRTGPHPPPSQTMKTTTPPPREGAF